MRAWIEVDLSALSENVGTIRSYIGPNVGVIAVVKADAYGHGIENVVQVLDSAGVDGFAVISHEEACRVRNLSDKSILVMGFLDPGELRDCIEKGFTLSLYDPAQIPEIQEAAELAGQAAQVEIKVETGLNRLGVSPEIALAWLTERHLGFQVVGVFSHLSNSADDKENARQLAKFLPVAEKARALGVRVHMTKSHALSKFASGYFDFVRVGLAVYGFEEVIPNLKPVMSAKSVIMQRKRLAKGEGVSYGKLFIAQEDMDIAIVAMGYAEGLSLSMSERLRVLVNGHWSRQIGRICMNLCVLDVSGVPAERGDEVVFVGTQGSHTIRACDIADWTGIRQHEIVTRLGKSLPKVVKVPNEAVGGPPTLL